jgi:hypothetical protein
MFSLKDLQKTQYIPSIKPIQATLVLPKISSASQPAHENIDVSEITSNTEHLLESLTADSTAREQNVDLGLIYSVGYGINYAKNRSQLPNATFLNDNGGKVTKGYVGDNSIKPMTANLIL